MLNLTIRLQGIIARNAGCVSTRMYYTGIKVVEEGRVKRMRVDGV